MKIFETTRGRPVAADAVPAFCPICGFELVGDTPIGLERTALVTAHAQMEHAEGIGVLTKLHRGMPAARIRALLVDMAPVVDHGPLPIDVILLERKDPDTHPSMTVETFDLNPTHGASWPAYAWEFEQPR